MQTHKRCLITYASRGREDYPAGLRRLIPSAMRFGLGTDQNNCIIAVSPDLPDATVNGIGIHRWIPHMPTHQEIPYGFKPWLFRYAFDMGFDQVLWCDSTIIIHKPLDLIWAIAEKRGLFVADNPGCPEATWTSDDCLRQMGCSVDQARQFNEIMACALAIDITHDKGKQVFDAWWELCNDGISFAGREGSARPDFRGHRHDQSCISYLCQKHGVEYAPYGLLTYHGGDMLKFPQHILCNTGIGQI